MCVSKQTASKRVSLTPKKKYYKIKSKIVADFKNKLKKKTFLYDSPKN